MNIFAVPTFFIAGIMTLSPCQAISWPWGPKNYEECLSEEMKGRSNDQRSIVSDACRKKYPATPSFLDIDYEGTLNCKDGFNPYVYVIKIQSNAIYVGKLEFNVVYRASGIIRGIINENKKSLIAPSKNANFELNFETGKGVTKLYDPGTEILNFECQE